ncbi:MOSC domain-containing protein [Allopusillimonas soli]|uniref:MOSC N-terminal beta barrel domain-containing protein n=1 Tax=Allopusillimonas soli TaxID=659016 RepID=A0A853FIQ5_9BURK|nr:MOSC N-terminal beta barrel domain-containing protein [Allopusillimonas soli]NYT37846.1 MOSC N-terminal beta barrel domain-containing protein [Allopusillimonas soli]TEA73750.1 MOSC domain-containing protein [Allopusillimonas soli]
MSVRILSLHSYPVKSCAGISHEEAAVSQGGMPLDRQWVIVDHQGIFMTQRTCARMALIQPSLQHGTHGDLTLNAPGMPAIVIPWLVDTAHPPRVHVRIWAADTLGFDEGDAAAQWLETFLGVPCRLLRVHPEAQRIASPDHVDFWRERHQAWAPGFPARHQFGFADGFPFLICNQGSLDELNQQLAERSVAPVPMNRFRPSIVVEGLDGYEEDYLGGMQIGSLTFAFVKRCARCPIPNIDQATAISAPEPGITLARHRQFPEGVLFGVNAVVGGAGPGAILCVGDAVEPEYDL